MSSHGQSLAHLQIVLTLTKPPRHHNIMPGLLAASTQGDPAGVPVISLENALQGLRGLPGAIVVSMGDGLGTIRNKKTPGSAGSWWAV